MTIVFIYDTDVARESDGHGLRALGNVISKSHSGIYCFYQQCDDDVHDLIRKFNRSTRGSLLLIGHGAGGTKAIEVAEQLQKDQIEVDHLVLLNPTTVWRWGRFNFTDCIIPPNVLHTQCFYRSSFLHRHFCPVRTSSGTLHSTLMHVGHAEIASDEYVKNYITIAAEALHQE